MRKCRRSYFLFLLFSFLFFSLLFFYFLSFILLLFFFYLFSFISFISFSGGFFFVFFFSFLFFCFSSFSFLLCFSFFFFLFFSFFFFFCAVCQIPWTKHRYAISIPGKEGGISKTEHEQPSQPYKKQNAPSFTTQRIRNLKNLILWKTHPIIVPFGFYIIKHFSLSFSCVPFCQVSVPVRTLSWHPAWLAIPSAMVRPSSALY